MKRRKIRRYRRGKKNSLMKFIGILGIITLAIICGYLTAKYLAAPLLGYDTEVLKLELPSDIFGNNEKNLDDEGYALQYGVFSSQERALALKKRLLDDGIKAKIKKSSGNYKVISNICPTKGKAVNVLKNTQTDIVSDIFITTI